MLNAVQPQYHKGGYEPAIYLVDDGSLYPPQEVTNWADEVFEAYGAIEEKMKAIGIHSYNRLMDLIREANPSKCYLAGMALHGTDDATTLIKSHLLEASAGKVMVF